jgi:glycosyltransferase involved in cell wall biosynthesis
MRVCMITPHLPPEQAANALLPVMLAEALADMGVTARFVSHRSLYSGPQEVVHGADHVPRRGRDAFSRSMLGALVTGSRMAIGAARAVRESDVVHLHGNGFIIEVGGFLARQLRKPCIVTLYGTDVWDHDPRQHRRFARVVRGAACRAFYSRGLRDFATPLGLAPDPSEVVYAPVSSSFQNVSQTERLAIRRELGVGDEPLLLMVKRLHPVAAHDTLLKALPRIVREFPRVTLWLAGYGELRDALEAQARSLGVASTVRFLGRVAHDSMPRYYAAADLFVLSSDVESWGTVMLEALACGTPVVSTSTPGGLEVKEHFPDDVTVVPRRDPDALAVAVCAALAARRRTAAATERRIRAEFTPSYCAARYLELYRHALGGT